MSQLHSLRSQSAGSWCARAEAQSSWWWLGIFSLAYFPITMIRAAARPVWFDEIFTLLISRMSLHRIWDILSSGGEPNPPACYFLTHWCLRLFGESELVLRLPEIFGYWLMSVFVFLFVRRRCSPFAAAAAMCFALSTKAYVQYAVEARPYGLVLGFCALGAFCWQYASDGASARTRTIATIGFSLALMAAICSHYYAVLLLIPFGIGELVRWWKIGRLNRALSAALVASLLPLIPLYPAVSRGSKFITSLVKASPVFWAKPDKFTVPLFFTEMLANTIVPLLLTALIAVLFRTFWQPEEDKDPRPRRPPVYEVAMVVALAALPVFAMVIGIALTGSFILRYSLSSAVGCSLVFGFLTYRGSAGYPSIAAVAALVFFGWFVGNGLHWPRPVVVPPPPDVASVDDKTPIVIANPFSFLNILHYAPPEFRERIHYLTDLDAVTKIPDFVPELALGQLKTWIPVPVEDYKAFVAAHHRFALFADGDKRQVWVQTRLVEDGHAVRLTTSKSGDLYAVTTAGGS